MNIEILPMITIEEAFKQYKEEQIRLKLNPPKHCFVVTSISTQNTFSIAPKKAFAK